MADKTKTELMAEIETLEARVRDAEDKIPAAPREVPEATALAQCIRSLDRLRDLTKRTGYSSVYGDGRREPDAVDRTLRALMAKYDFVPEVVREECTRRHVEDIRPEEIVSLVRSNVYALDGSGGL